MKKLSIISISILLGACFHEAVEAPKKVEAVIDYPPLLEQESFEHLQEEATLKPFEEATEENQFEVITDAQNLALDFITRIMNVLEIANQELGIVANSDYVTSTGLQPSPSFKVGSRSKNILFASDDNCAAPDNDNETNTSSVVWDDVNDDGKPLEGDKWFYIIENCQNESNNSFVTGVIEYSGMRNPFPTQEDLLDETIRTDLFSNYNFTFDVQISYPNENTAYYKDTLLTLSRSVNDAEEDITELQAGSGSLFGVASESGRYLFAPDHLDALSNDDSEILSFDVDGTYYLGSSEVSEYVTVTTEETLEFSYESQNDLQQSSSKFANLKLTSGKIKFVGKDNYTIIFSAAEPFVTEEEQEIETFRLEIDYDGDGEIDKNSSDAIDQWLFNRSDFTLLNLTGG